MNKIALACLAATSVLVSAPLLTTTPANAQIDVQVGSHDRDRDRDRHDIVVGDHAHCHIVKIRERHGDHVEFRTERHCD